MRSLTELQADALKEALHAADALMRFNTYLPRSGLLLLASRFRDETREALGMQAVGHPSRGNVFSPLDDLTSTELDTIAGAVTILLQERFTLVMNNPELPKLLREFEAELNDQKAERRQIQASIAS